MRKVHRAVSIKLKLNMAVSVADGVPTMLPHGILLLRCHGRELSHTVGVAVTSSAHQFHSVDGEVATCRVHSL